MQKQEVIFLRKRFCVHKREVVFTKTTSVCANGLIVCRSTCPPLFRSLKQLKIIALPLPLFASFSNLIASYITLQYFFKGTTPLWPQPIPFNNIFGLRRNLNNISLVTHIDCNACLCRSNKSLTSFASFYTRNIIGEASLLLLLLLFY